MNRPTITRCADQLSEWIQRGAGQGQWQEPSQQLYRHLVAPYQAALSDSAIDTLVFVSDPTLRNMPLAALHNGETFLIEDYALAITSSLNLVDPRPMSQTNPRLLLAGISEAVQGEQALPNVASELAAIQALYGGDVLLNQAFTTEQLAQQMQQRPYNMVHIASHARFFTDSQQGFLLTHDQKLSLKQLRHIIQPLKYRQQPLELLVLSACESASGSHEAQLGLAGVALKAGARSAMGSLWLMDDAGTAHLMESFYQHLTEVNTTKAQALRQAQLTLLKSDRFDHPMYWSGFLLMDNWL